MENIKNNRGEVNACLPPSEQKWTLINFCEFDKFAAKSYCAIHHVDPKLNLGDITQVDEKEIADFNMMSWGFPCTDISVAGKQQGFIDENGEKTRSGMYYEGIRILQEKKPALSIIENVKNLTSKKFKAEFETVLTDLEDAGYNTYWQVLNAKNYGIPQNRERVFIVSIRKDLDNGQFKFPEPFDNGIRLKDLLEDMVDEKYYVSDDKVLKMIQSMDAITKETILRDDICPIDKSYNGSQCKDTANCITSREDRRISNHKAEGTAIAENTLHQIGHIGNSNSAGNRVYDSKNIARTITGTAGGGGGKTGLYKISSIRPSTPKIKNNTILKIGNINPSGRGMNGCVYSELGILPTLTTNKGEGCKVAIQQATKGGFIECEVGGVADLSYPGSKTRRGRVQDGGQTSPTITATATGICKIEQSEKLSHAEWKQQMYARFIEDSDGYVSGVDTNHSQAFGYKAPLKGISRTLKANAHDAGCVEGIRVRKLTPQECFRLMGFSDEAFAAAQSAGISNSQLYKQAGNSIVVDVLYYIYVELYKAMPYLFDDLRLSSFFSGIGAFEVALDKLYEGINSGNFTKPSEE